MFSYTVDHEADKTPPEDGCDSDVRNAHAERPPQGTANTDSDDYNSDSDDAEDSSSESSDEGDVTMTSTDGNSVSP